MKKTTLKIIIALLLSIVLVSFAACNGADNAEETSAPTEAAAAGLSGEITVSGSTSVEKVGVALGDEFMALYPDVTYTYEGIGSSGGVKNANDATTMLGTASRNIKDSEKEYGMTEKVLAYDGIAVIVNPENGVSELTVEQVQGIYLGEITNWSEVGGEDAEIAVVSREDGSGTRGAFEEIVEFEDALTASALIKDGNGNVQATVAETPLAIGYVSFTYVDESVKGVLIEDAEPTVENVLNGSYKISRPFNIVYHEENLSDAAKAFLEWIDTAEAKEIIAEKGAIPLADGASSEGNAEEVAEEIAGEITVSGSTSVEKVGVALGDEFMALYPGVTYTYEGIGSSGGVKNANDATTMLGTASRNIKDSEKEYGMTEKVLAYDGIAVIVNPENGVSELTVEQVQKIYLGEITNWSEVGGIDAEIAVISREDGSGTRGAFEEIVDFEDALTADALIKDGNGNVQATVAETPLAIGYVSFTYLDETVKGVLIEGAEPTVENVLNGSYKISRPFNIVYHEANLTDAAKAFLIWIDTAEAKEIIAEKGAIPLADGAAAEETMEMPENVEGDITVSGSTSVEKVGVALGDEFMALYPGVTYTYEGIGSSGGVKNANDATTMLGTASRNIKDSEKEYGMTEKVLAYDGIAVIVNPENGVSELTVEQVQKIYLGEITNWSEVGGIDAEIAVISREDGSGTRGAFEEIVDFEDALTADALIKDGNGNVQATVAETPLAIGYVSFTYLDETVKGVLIEGAEPTVENVLNGSYKISRPFNIVYHEANLTDAAKAFLIWIDTDEAKEIIAEKGAIPLS